MTINGIQNTMSEDEGEGFIGGVVGKGMKRSRSAYFMV